MTCRMVGCADPNCQRLLAWQGWRVAEQARHAQALLDALSPAATTTRGAGP